MGKLMGPETRPEARAGTQRVIRRAATVEAAQAEAAEATAGVNAANAEANGDEVGVAGAESQSEGDHSQSDQSMEAVTAVEVHRVGYAPIVRVDATRREIELCATSEAVDSYGTIFSYKASKEAFGCWLGNVREMHERKAVGQRVAVRFDDAARKVFVTIRISRGAQDTWEKVCDGTLRGASIGAANVKWDPSQPSLWDASNGTPPPRVATAYDLVELSLVDNPSNPDALGFTFVRDAVPDVRLLDRLDAEPEPEVNAENEKVAEDTEGTRTEADGVQARARGRSLDQDQPQGGYGSGNERLHAAAVAVMQSCGCALCEAALAALAEDVDDLTTDGEMGGDEDAGMPRIRGLQTPRQATRVREATLARALQASLRASLGSSARRLDTLDAQVRATRGAVDASGEALRGIHERVGQVAASVERTVMRAMESMGELDQRLERLEAQPMPGGPAARAVEKQHPLHARDWGREQAGQPASAEEQYRALEALAGRIADPQAQIAVAAELIRLQRERG